jgi:hypothetical protein
MINNKIYNQKYFKRMSSMPGWYENGNKMGDVIFKMFKPKTVVDFGCGTARTIHRLFIKGCKVRGIEGSLNSAKNFIPIEVLSYVEQGDVTEPIVLNDRYDVAICTEVAEHIPTNKSEQLIENLVNASDLIVFSAAGLGQTAPSHINLQTLNFWDDIFHKYGYGMYLNKTIIYKAELSKLNVKQIYINNGVIFGKVKE